MDIILTMLVASISLAGLTYALGALIYALPLPLRGVKKWAPLLMSDALLTFTLAITFGALLYAARTSFSLMGVSREELVNEISTIATSMARAYLFFKLMQNFYNAIFSLKFVGLPLGKVLEGLYHLFSMIQPVGNWASSFTLELLTLVFQLGAYGWTFIYVLSVVSEMILPFMIATGALLVGIPFRLTKAAGASLIGFAIATYVVLPLIIVVLDLLQLYNPAFKILIEVVLRINTEGPKIGVAYPYGSVKDSVGNAVPFVYLRFADASGKFGLYPVDAEGRYTTKVPLGGSPWPEAIVYVDLYGYEYYAGTVDLRNYGIGDGEEGVVNLRLGRVVVPSEGVALVGRVRMESFSAKTNTENGITYITFKIKALSNTDVRIVVTGVLNGQVSVVSSSPLSQGKMEIGTWEGMPSYVLSFVMGAGEEKEIIVYGKTGYFKAPAFYSIGYLANLLGASVKIAFSEASSATDVSYALIAPFVVSALPFMHVLLTASVARAIASLISEGSKNLLVRMW